MGVGASLIKYVAEYHAKKDKETVNQMMSTTFAFYLAIGLIIFISMIVIGIFYASFFGIEGALVDKARLMAFLVALGALTSWPLRSIGSVLPGLQRYDIGAVISFSTTMVNSVATVILLANGYGIVELVLTSIIVGAIGQLITVVITQREAPYLQIRAGYMNLRTMKKIFTFSAVVFLGQIISLFVLGMDRVIVGAVVSVAAITIYEVARKLHDLIFHNANLLESALLPAGAEMDAKGDRTSIKRLIIRGGKYKCALTLSLSSVVFALAPAIISTWIGSSLVDVGEVSLYTRAFVSYLFFYSSWGVLGIILLSQEKYRPILVVNIGIGVTNLVLSIIFTIMYGAIGVILGTIVPWFIVLPFLIPYGLRLTRMPARKYYKGVILPTYPPAIATMLALFVINYFYTPDTLIEAGLLCLFGLLIYFGAFYSFGLSKKEKGEFWSFFKNHLD
jgi:O-antigen/teichoic acid export membrane protein